MSKKCQTSEMSDNCVALTSTKNISTFVIVLDVEHKRTEVKENLTPTDLKKKVNNFHFNNRYYKLYKLMMCSLIT